MLFQLLICYKNERKQQKSCKYTLKIVSGTHNEFLNDFRPNLIFQEISGKVTGKVSGKVTGKVSGKVTGKFP